ncbi:hypothetical protein BS50DRAFT_617182 [Corynespora cassiicola Philippines]|uniref:Uncharacterized protein n=1 Tax=Corynespora cassiicola Philippines TaxID=1448308 RepID=A0A2T2P257_CORCC|nr:hypothetical protein BS50DRAFT_617182 [Corynespora cassiicola Philippines]
MHIYLKAKTKAPTGERSGGKQHETNTMTSPIGQGTSFPTASPAPDISQSLTKVYGQLTSRIEADTTSTHQAPLLITTERMGLILTHPDRVLEVQHVEYVSTQKITTVGVISAPSVLQITRTFDVEPLLLTEAEVIKWACLRVLLDGDESTFELAVYLESSAF